MVCNYHSLNHYHCRPLCFRYDGRWWVVQSSESNYRQKHKPQAINQDGITMDLISRTILGYTAEVVGVSPDDILSEVKTQELVLARSIFADIAYSEYLYTYCQIGRIIKRNHATVMHNLEILAINMRARPDIKFLRTQVLNRTRDFLQH